MIGTGFVVVWKHPAMHMADGCRHIAAPSVIEMYTVHVLLVRKHFLSYRVLSTRSWHCFLAYVQA